MAHALDAVAVDAHPGEHVHDVAWAPFPEQLNPDAHATQEAKAAVQLLDVVAEDA